MKSLFRLIAVGTALCGLSAGARAIGDFPASGPSDLGVIQIDSHGNQGAPQPGSTLLHDGHVAFLDPAGAPL